MTKLFLVLSAGIFFGTACKKSYNGLGAFALNGELNPNTVTLHLYPAAMEYLQLPLNRYFIYKDSATAAIDSVRVTQSSTDVVTTAATSGYPGMPTINRDRYSLTLTKFQLPATSTVWCKGVANGSTFSGLVNATLTDTSIAFIETPYNLQTFWHSYFSSGANVAVSIASLVVEGITYTDVKKFSTNNGLPPTDAGFIAITNYWAKGIGIIKREIRGNASVKTYLLLRYG